MLQHLFRVEHLLAMPKPTKVSRTRERAISPTHEQTQTLLAISRSGTPLLGVKFGSLGLVRAFRSCGCHLQPQRRYREAKLHHTKVHARTMIRRWHFNFTAAFHQPQERSMQHADARSSVAACVVSAFTSIEGVLPILNLGRNQSMTSNDAEEPLKTCGRKACDRQHWQLFNQLSHRVCWEELLKGLVEAS
jgi:hypothetical protein